MFVNKKKKDELMGLILCHLKWSLLLLKTECKNAIKAQCSVLFPFCKCIKLYIYECTNWIRYWIRYEIPSFLSSTVLLYKILRTCFHILKKKNET